ncbi:uncharacterized protein TrAtP1_000634 [Trichoderma atroviride]|uniref:uncharacterized protein n=1 Tax=Hypocrea atroviridis TaxID=63577 RepID=UPI0033180CE5|nr:hypothetical protein TrAtP1_000634 [Trichoderma atroviride]
MARAGRHLEGHALDESSVQVLRGAHPALHGGLSREARRPVGLSLLFVVWDLPYDCFIAPRHAGAGRRIVLQQKETAPDASGR